MKNENFVAELKLWIEKYFNSLLNLEEFIKDYKLKQFIQNERVLITTFRERKKNKDELISDKDFTSKINEVKVIANTFTDWINQNGKERVINNSLFKEMIENSNHILYVEDFYDEIGLPIGLEEIRNIDFDEVKKDRDKLRILNELGIIKLLDEKYQKVTGYQNLEQIARIIIKLGFTNSKDIKTIAKPLRSLIYEDGEINKDEERISGILRLLYLKE